MIQIEDGALLQNQLVTWRRAFHQIPELGCELTQTIAYLVEELKKMDISFAILDKGAGVLANIGQGEETILLRADMDALPMKEESMEPFASTNGNMHACGHDLHTSMLLGAAKVLKEKEAQLHTHVCLLFQSGEENFSGAKEVVRQGILEQVDKAFALHVASQVPLGVIAYGTHPMAAVTAFAITFQGKGGHGSTPHLCVDPIQAGIRCYEALHALVALECNANDETVLTIGQFQAGTKENIIPEQCVLKGTLRTFQDKNKHMILQRIQEILAGIDQMCKTTHTIHLLGDVDAVVCDPTWMKQCADEIQKQYPQRTVTDGFHVMGSEDFACISHMVPSCYFGIGAAIGPIETCYGQHNPNVRFHEGSLLIGVEAYLSAVNAM